MAQVPLWVYLGVLVGTFVVSALLTPLALAVALHRSLLDHPGPAKSHTEAVPYLGGTAIAVAFAGSVGVMALVERPASGLGTLGVILGVAVGLALVGLADDLRRLPVWLRLLAEVGAGLALWTQGVTLHLASVPHLLDAPASVVFVVVVTNAVNLLDNMDGLAAGLVVVASLGFFAIAVLNGDFLVAALAVALAGGAGGFLWHNFHPARIYMGDSGSLFLGFLLATLALKLRSNPLERVDVAALVSVIGVALFDTTLVVVTRLARRVSPMRGGRDHTSHRLVRRGLGVRATVGSIYAAAVALAGLGILLDLHPAWRAPALAGLVVLGVAGISLLAFVDRGATEAELRAAPSAPAAESAAPRPSRPQPVVSRWALSTLARRVR